MTTPPSSLPLRPLTPLERAILRAVVELGDDPNTERVHQRVNEYLKTTLITVYNRLKWMAVDGYLVHLGEGKKARQCWRPAFDLTEVLREP